MNRRGVLVALGAVLAGCSGSGEEPTETETETRTVTPTETEPPTPTATPTPDPQAAAGGRIESARERLRTAAETYWSGLDALAFPSLEPGFDPAPVEEALSAARADLEAADGGVTSAQQATVRRLERYAGVLDRMLTATDALLTGVDHGRQAVSLTEEGQFGGALDRLDRARESLDAAESGLNEARFTFRRLRQNVEGDDLAVEDAASAVGLVDSLITGLRAVYDAQEAFVDGRDHYASGAEDYDAGEYGLAAAAFSDAEEDFLIAQDRFDDAASAAPSELDPVVERGACASGSYRTAAEEMNRAALLIGSDDEQASASVDAAEAALREPC